MFLRLTYGEDHTRILVNTDHVDAIEKSSDLSRGNTVLYLSSPLEPEVPGTGWIFVWEDFKDVEQTLVECLDVKSVRKK
jgi:hypothetical protein